MKFLLKVCATLCCFYGIVLPLVFGGFPRRPAQATTNPGAPADFSFVQHGSILSPLLKALSEQYTERDLTPRLRPDSRYVRYMKRLYRVSSKQDRTYGKITSHVYNTVRLIAPRDECFEHSKDFLMQGLLYNLDRVRAQEQLLKSVLLYSFDKDLETPFTSVCYLDVKEQENADQQFCSSSHYSVSFKAHIERSHGHKWVEVDITTLLHPFIKSQKKNIYLLINLTCVEDRRQDGGAHECRDLVKLSFRSPSLLLYLNDTSEVAYQRWPSARSKNARQSVAMGDFMSPMEFEPAKRNKRWNRNLSKKPATLPSPAPSPTEHFPKYEFPTDDCDLYDFRVSFSQLKLDHWIIAPHKYNPRYCKGLCPRALGSVYGSPVHTMVQNIIYEKLDSSVPRPSCVPSEYNPLSVLTVENDGSIAYKEYEEMIATKCTCR